MPFFHNIPLKSTYRLVWGTYVDVNVRLRHEWRQTLRVHKCVHKHNLVKV
jgi:hypothetical protein